MPGMILETVRQNFAEEARKSAWVTGSIGEYRCLAVRDIKEFMQRKPGCQDRLVTEVKCCDNANNL